MESGLAQIGLQAFQNGRKQVESPMFSCMRNRHTVKYVLFQCRKSKEFGRGLWTDEIRKAKWGELKLEDVLTDPVSLKKAAKLIKRSGLIGYLQAQIEDDEQEGAEKVILGWRISSRKGVKGGHGG